MLVGFQDIDNVSVHCYDKLRRLTDVVQTGQAGGNSVVSKHIAQSFNAASQRTNITRYQSAGTTNLVASTIFTYDTVGRLSGIGHTKGAANLNTYAYTYDPLSRLKSVTSTAEGTTNYSYFNDSQLKSASGSKPTESYTYDTNGNRTMAGYTTIADNRTTADASFTYTYDAEGNLTRKTNKSTFQVVATYEWDHRNRLTKVNGGVTGPGGIEYEYDAFNRLVRRRAFDPNVPNQYWVYDEGINPVLQFDTGGNAGVGGISHRYIWSDYVDDLLSDEQISFPSNTVNTLWPLADHLGSIRDIADFNEATGITAIANHRTYDSFGKLVDETGTASIPFGYTGKLFDKTTGLQNNLNRWYDPNLGKWISQDPIGFAAGDANLYRYVGNGPTNAIDPSGLDEITLLEETIGILEERLEMARLAQGSYTGQDTRALSEKFDYNLHADSANGLRVVTFTRKRDGKVFVSFAGTEMSLTDLRDLRQDIYQGGFGFSGQYDEAITIVRKLIELHGADNIYLTGHSLGGGLASASALYFNLPASTFNSAGVHPFSIWNGAKGLKDDSKIRSYVVCGEGLNLAQDWIPFLMPNARGRRIELAQNNSSPLTLHGMNGIIEQIELEIRVTKRRLDRLNGGEK